jgi:hypothetical protein
VRKFFQTYPVLKAASIRYSVYVCYTRQDKFKETAHGSSVLLSCSVVVVKEGKERGEPQQKRGRWQGRPAARHRSTAAPRPEIPTHSSPEQHNRQRHTAVKSPPFKCVGTKQWREV